MEKISIIVNHTPVNEADSYEHLGVRFDKNLTSHEHVHNIYKRTLVRVKLLQRIRHTISPTIALKIYKVMIQPIMTYCSTLYLGLSSTQLDKFEKVNERAMNKRFLYLWSVSKRRYNEKQQLIFLCVFIN